MATGKETAKFSVKLDDQVSGPADAAADSLEGLRRRIAEGNERLKDMAGSMRRLRGSTEEVKRAKDELKAKLSSERDAISAATLALLKQGTSYDQLTAKSKKLTSDTKNVGAAMSSVGGPVGALRDRLTSLAETFSQAGSLSGVAAVGIAGLIAACAALTAAVAVAGIAFGKFVLEAANAARTANLFREAATGSALNAHNLGTQVDALARKVPTAKAALNDLAISLAKNGVGGQTLVDTFNAVGQAAAALGDDAGSKLRELVERGRLSQRFMVNPLELQGTGLQFDDLAKSLAKGMNVGIGAARMALLQGRVKLADGAKALREAVESKFGDINLRRMLDLNVLSEKFKETLGSLTKDVKLEPLLAGLKKLSELFGEGTVTGATIKQIVTLLGNGMVGSLRILLPLAGMFLKGMVVGTLDLLIGLFQLKNSLTKTFGNSDLLKNVDLLSLAFTAGKVAVMTVAAAVLLLGTVLAAGLAQIVAVGAVLFGLPMLASEAGKKLRDLDWEALGKSIVDGIVAGLKSGATLLVETMVGLADKVKKTFKGELRIQSPSKEMFEAGENTVEGYVGGIDSRTRDADAAIARMGAARPSAPSGGAARGLVLQVTNNFNIGIPPGMEPSQSAAVVASMKPALRAALTEMLDEVLVELGFPRTVTTTPEVPA